jgi:hypothetical protein
MRKSATVPLTVVAALGLAWRARAQDPCDPATFNGKTCQAAAHHGGYCSQGAWVPASYQEKYPNYYDAYRDYMSQGGVVNPAPKENCRRGVSGAHGGFGTIGAIHGAGS